MGGGSSPPAVQPASTTADIQQYYNTLAAEESQAMSNVNQENPFASLTYSNIGSGPGGVPLWKATTTLNPQVQSILDSLLQGTNNQVQQGNYTNPSATAAQTVGDMTHGITSDILGQYKDYLDPFFTQSTQQLDTQLRNQGLMPSASSNPSDPATWGPYERAMNQLRQNQGQTVSGLIAQVEPQAYGQATSQYMLPLTTAASELGLITPQYATSGYINTPQVKAPATDYTTAQANTQNALNQQYAQQTQANSNMMSGLFGIPTAILGGWAKSGGLQSAMAAAPFLLA